MPMLTLRSPNFDRRLAPDEEAELARRARAGDREARDTLIESNVPLALKRARQCRLGVALLGEEEAAAYGLLALCKAVDLFDPSRGFRLTTYVGDVVYKEVYRAAQTFGLPVAVPLHLQEAAARLDRGFPADSLKEWESAYMPSARAAIGGALSLDVPPAPGATPWADDLADRRGDDGRIGPDEVARLHAAIARLRPSDARLIRARWLPEDGRPRNYREIAAELGVSKERARQRVARAERSLRSLLEAGAGAGGRYTA